MNTVKYDKEITALLVIDPYNDFISEGGKVWERLKCVAEANNCIPHMTAVLSAARNAQLRVFYALHRRYRPGDYETWKYIAPIQKAAWSRKVFEYGTWGGEIRSEFVPQDGRCRGARTLVLERLCQHGSGSTAQEARHPETHRHRAHCTHVRRGDGTVCCGTRLRRHGGQGCDGGLFGRCHARRARRQHAELRRRRDHQRTRRVDGFARRSECAVARRRIVTTSSTPVRMPTR